MSPIACAPPGTEPSRWATAVHEAGHAVAAVILCVPFTRVTIKPTRAWKAAGSVHLRTPDANALGDGRVQIHRRVAVMLSGGYAQLVLGDRNKRSWSKGATQDTRACLWWLELLPTAERTDARHLASIRAAWIVHTWAEAIAAVAGALLDQTTLMRRDVVRILDDGWPGQRKGFMRRSRGGITRALAACGVK